MEQLTAYIADGLFTGESWLPGHAVIVRDGRISSLLPAADLPADFPAVRFSDAIIAPAFIDIQIYGAGERLFSAWPEPASLEKLVTHNRGGGTILCLPTIATNSGDIYRMGIDAIRSYWDAGGKGVYGLHLEGPWINPVKRGAHVSGFICHPDPVEVAALLEYGRGVIRMVTLAPESCSDEVLEMIRAEGIVISAGHSDASYAQAMDSFDKGIPAVTHLFNAMSPLQHRAPGLAGAAMDHGRVMASIIPDGVHVDFAAVRIAKAVMKERLFVITDAVTATDTGPYPHRAAGNKFESGGVLSGSALRMNAAVRNLVEQVHISMDEALRMCSLYPARLLGKDGHAGKLREGYEASLVVLNKNFDVLELVG
ncbi:MAG: N-acetylglucosamine-6-phosphate deacetylase [Chitinophagaceae bacterium]|nr:MAG: N-acetylglucosamine-6-phosphate deacetylase [Chitinophagaceae bacterium]